VPALVLLTIIYFALPYAGITVEPFGATVICLIGVLAVYAEEIFWAGIISIDRGQWEAARSTGLNFIRTLFFVVLPQAIRMCIPPMTNWTIAITKLTALGSVVAAQEILNQSMSAQALAANPSPLTLGAFLYLVIFIPLVVGSRWIERRFGWAK